MQMYVFVKLKNFDTMCIDNYNDIKSHKIKINSLN